MKNGETDRVWGGGGNYFLLQQMDYIRKEICLPIVRLWGGGIVDVCMENGCRIYVDNMTGEIFRLLFPLLFIGQ